MLLSIYFNAIYIWMQDFLTVEENENLSWLNQFGTIGTFLKKNDIKLINKTTIGLMMFLFWFLFYRRN
jgi:hypothetical protein